MVASAGILAPKDSKHALNPSLRLRRLVNQHTQKQYRPESYLSLNSRPAAVNDLFRLSTIPIQERLGPCGWSGFDRTIGEPRLAQAIFLIFFSNKEATAC